MSFTVKIESGTYAGNGSAREIAPVGGGPDLALTKRINGTATVAYTMWRSMRRNLANSPGGGFAAKPNQLTDLTRDGIYVGSGQSQAGALYAYLAIKALRGSKHFAAGRYYQAASAARNLQGMEGCPFRPDVLWLHRATDGNGGCFTTSAHPAGLANGFAGATGATLVTALLSDGFSIGNSPTTSPAGDYVDWWALREIPGAVKVGMFTSDGGAASIDVGFEPTAVLVKNIDAAQPLMILTAGMAANGVASIPVTAAATDAAAIVSLSSTGFSLGASVAVAGAGQRVVWIALRDGEYSPGRT